MAVVDDEMREYLLEAAIEAKLLREHPVPDSLRLRSGILKEVLNRLGEELGRQLATRVAQYLGIFPSTFQPKLNQMHNWQVTYNPSDVTVKAKTQDCGIPPEYFDEMVELQREVSALERKEHERLLQSSTRYVGLEILKSKLLSLPTIPAGKYPIADHEIIEGQEQGIQLSWKITKQRIGPLEQVALSLAGDHEMFGFFMRDMVELLGVPVGERWDSTLKIFVALWPFDRLVSHN